jgi:hypothetical protein
MTLEDFHKTTEERRWGVHAQLLLDEKKPPVNIMEQFGTHWIEAGHRIREQIADDRILVRLLRHMLPTYQGNPVKLFRGENQERWEARKVGLAWTSNIDVARMFGRGLNSTPLGGVLLEGSFNPEAIICGPNSHSSYLGEEQFTIDPFYVTKIVPIEKFPPCP